MLDIINGSTVKMATLFERQYCKRQMVKINIKIIEISS